MALREQRRCLARHCCCLTRPRRTTTGSTCADLAALPLVRLSACLLPLFKDSCVCLHMNRIDTDRHHTAFNTLCQGSWTTTHRRFSMFPAACPHPTHFCLRRYRVLQQLPHLTPDISTCTATATHMLFPSISRRTPAAAPGLYTSASPVCLQLVEQLRLRCWACWCGFCDTY